ncbi:geminin [Lutzomyia longipalpis]|uniref:geminin n=1 Tax=Lutzomyia longipalpis TaxID=7200 RepID=UPI0024845D4A|nr:geminin [Lutzomyia longipalpis]
MSANTNKIFIQVESDEVQQENLKNSRRTFKVLQKNAKDKENLVGRPIVPSGKEGLAKQKADFDEDKVAQKKRKQTTTSQHVQTDSEESCDQQITETDLTTTAGPSHKYWEILAEKRRVALEDALKENESLHDKIASLEAELKVSREMLEETQNLVTILTEMLDEKDDEAPEVDAKPAEDDAEQAGTEKPEEEEAAGE